jgi:hypothetical protein
MRLEGRYPEDALPRLQGSSAAVGLALGGVALLAGVALFVTLVFPIVFGVRWFSGTLPGLWDHTMVMGRVLIVTLAANLLNLWTFWVRRKPDASLASTVSVVFAFVALAPALLLSWSHWSAIGGALGAVTYVHVAASGAFVFSTFITFSASDPWAP